MTKESTENQKPAEVKEKEPKEPVRNISAVAREAILAGKSNADALAAVKAEFPDSNTSTSSIAWYRNDLRKKGHEVASPKKPKAEKPVKEKVAKEDAKGEVKAKPSKGKAQPAGEFE